MTDAEKWAKAERLERAALGWRYDALYYSGERHAIRIRHAERLEGYMTDTLESIA